MEQESLENLTPKKAEKPKLTEKAKQRYVESFRKAGFQDLSTNRLTNPELDQLNTQIDHLVDAGDARTGHLLELREFLNRNQALFPELSHGTSSDVLGSVLAHGLHPRSRALSLLDQETQHIGEGAKGNFNRRFVEGATEVYMGIGQGGLGTTIAYAEMVGNPNWNYNHLTLEDLQRLQTEYQKNLEDVGARDWEAKLVLEDRLAAIGKALVRHQRGTSPDFPVVLGVVRNSRDNVDPKDPSLRFITNYRQGGRYLKTESGFDSEVAVTIDQTEDSRSIQVIATSSSHKAAVESIIQGANKGDMQIISIEALKLLAELGYPRVGEGYSQAMEYLQYIIYKNNRYIERAVDEFQRGLPPFDYSTLEEP